MKLTLALQRQDQLDPELAAAWFTLLSQFPGDLQGHSSWTASIEQVVVKHFSLALNCLGRREEDLLRSIVAFLRTALVRTLCLW